MRWYSLVSFVLDYYFFIWTKYAQSSPHGCPIGHNQIQYGSAGNLTKGDVCLGKGGACAVSLRLFGWSLPMCTIVQQPMKRHCYTKGTSTYSEPYYPVISFQLLHNCIFNLFYIIERNLCTDFTIIFQLAITRPENLIPSTFKWNDHSFQFPLPLFPNAPCFPFSICFQLTYLPSIYSPSLYYQI